MDADQVALDAQLPLPFRLRLRVGEVMPVEAPQRIADATRELRERGTALARRASRVAEVVEALGKRDWRLVGDDLVGGGRETVNSNGFAVLGGEPLPNAITVARDARPGEIAADLAAAFGPDAGEVPVEATVQVDGYDLPVRVQGGSMTLVYSLRTYLETFSVRG